MRQIKRLTVMATRYMTGIVSKASVLKFQDTIMKVGSQPVFENGSPWGKQWISQILNNQAVVI